ncbi:hypothetical protein ACFLZJ_01070 [Nanoarchaeota archaeon]
MSKQKTGLVIFWIGIIWAFAWGIIGSLIFSPLSRNLTIEELSQTAWSYTGPLFLSWAFAVPLAALIAGIGILMYSGAKNSVVWKFGIGVALVIFIAMNASSIGHIPILFGIGGVLILLSFIGILWYWAKERARMKGRDRISADLRLVGYVFLVIAAWFTCGTGSIPFMKSLESIPVSSPIHIMIFFTLGWIFLFLSHKKSAKIKK